MSAVNSAIRSFFILERDAVKRLPQSFHKTDRFMRANVSLLLKGWRFSHPRGRHRPQRKTTQSSIVALLTTLRSFSNPIGAYTATQKRQRPLGVPRRCRPRWELTLVPVDPTTAPTPRCHFLLYCSLHLQGRDKDTTWFEVYRVFVRCCLSLSL